MKENKTSPVGKMLSFKITHYSYCEAKVSNASQDDPSMRT